MTTAPAHVPKRRMGDAVEPREVGLLAEFENPGVLLHAAEKVRDAGFTKWDCHTPFPVHGLDRAMGMKMTLLPVFIFCCGALGALTGFFLQWFTNAVDVKLYLPMEVIGYPFLISGKPFLSGSVYPIVMFELTILFSAFGAVFGMLGFNRLPKFYNPLFKIRRFERVTTDGFFIVVDANDPKFRRDAAEDLLLNAGATAVEPIID